MPTPIKTSAALLAAVSLSVITFGAVYASNDPSAPSTTVGSPPTGPTEPGPTDPGVATTAPPAPAPGEPTTTIPAAPPASPAPGPQPGTGSGLPADATFQQIQQAIAPMFGPTDDLMAEFTLFGITPPAGVPTPEGAVVDSFEIAFNDVYPTADEPWYDAAIVFTTTTPAPDVVTMYQTEMVAAGYTQTGDSVENTDSGRQIRWLDYDIPGATHFMAEMSVGIIDDPDVDFVQIEFADTVDPALAAPFNKWTGLPFVDQATAINDASVGNFLSFGTNARISTEYEMAIAPADLEAQFLASLEGTPYAVNADRSSPGEWAVLEGGEFNEITVYFHEGFVEGGSRLVIDATFELQPTGPTTPSPTTMAPATTGPTEPVPTTSGPTGPGPTQPGATTSGPTAPGPTEPSPTTSGPTTPGPTQPGATTTVPPAPAPGVTTTVPGAPPASAPSQAPGAGAGLPANATLQQLQQAILPMLGPTEDVLGEFTIFGITPPSGVPTPAGADVVEFDMQFSDLHRPDESFYWATIVFTSTAPAADLVTLYQTEMVAAGYTQTGDSVRNTDSGRQIRWLDYDIPGATHFMAEMSVGIVDDADVDWVQIEFREALDAGLGAAFTGWTGLPIVDQATTINDATIGNYIFGDQVAIEAGFDMAIPHSELEAQFLASLEGTPYTVNADRSSPGEWAVLEGGGFTEMTVHFTEGVEEGTSQLNINARYDLQA